MANLRDIVTRAFRKTGIGGTGDELTADEIAEGVDAFNMMMHGFALRGVNVEHADQVATDQIALDPKFHEGLVYILAGRISPDYQVPQAFDADDWFRTFQAAYLVIDPVAMPEGLKDLPSQYAVQRERFG